MIIVLSIVSANNSKQTETVEICIKTKHLEYSTVLSELMCKGLKKFDYFKED